MPDLTSTIDTHLQAYTEADPGRRADLVAQVWAADGRLVDPPLDGTGHDEIGALTDLVLGQFPDHHFERTTAVDAHHDMARYGWALVAGDGTITLTGIDVAQVADDGKLRRITGFFGELATLDATPVS